MVESMEQKKVTVEIFGETYRFRTDGDPAYVKQLAGIVDKDMRAAAQKACTFSGNKIGVLAALQLADDYCKLKKDYDELVELLEDK
jgi:cell division protein ZapA